MSRDIRNPANMPNLPAQFMTRLRRSLETGQMIQVWISSIYSAAR